MEIEAIHSFKMLLEAKSSLSLYLHIVKTQHNVGVWPSTPDIERQLVWDRRALWDSLGVDDETIKGHQFAIGELEIPVIWRLRRVTLQDAILWWSKAHWHERTQPNSFLCPSMYPAPWSDRAKTWIKEKRHRKLAHSDDPLRDTGVEFMVHVAADDYEFMNLLSVSLFALLAKAILEDSTFMNVMLSAFVQWEAFWRPTTKKMHPYHEPPDVVPSLQNHFLSRLKDRQNWIQAALTKARDVSAAVNFSPEISMEGC